MLMHSRYRNVIMRIALTSICFLLAFNLTIKAQEFTTYTVKKDDTATSLAKQFNTTKEEIYRFNPEIKNGLKIGALLVIPKNLKPAKNVPETNTSSTVQERVPTTFITHKVKRKETLFGLSKKYEVSEDEIKKYNKRLYSQQLKRRDQIRIPVFSEIIISENQTVKQPEFVIKETPVAEVERIMADMTHTVQPKEGKFGISRKYGMTIAELEAMNPNMEEPIQPGQILKVKGKVAQESAVIEDDRFMFYEVKPKENFFRLEERFNISEDSLIALNPSLEEGLKAGMIIKIPKQGNTISVFNKANIVKLENRITNYEPKTVALMLPFNIHKVGRDSISTAEERIKRDRVMRISLDFYSGALMALEDAKKKGLSTTIKVYDTEQSVSKVNKIIRENNFNDVDVVIGPLLNNTVEETADKLRRFNIPVISPLSNKSANGRSNLVQSRPTDVMMHQTMLTYLDSIHTSQNIVIVADSKSKTLKDKLMARFPFATVLVPEKDNFLYQNKVSDQLIDGKDNWFLVATEDVALLSNLTSYLNALSTDNQIQLFALEKNSAFESEDISNYHLSKLKFSFPSIDREFETDIQDSFVANYEGKYGIVPNKFAVRGYDVMYDIILRLATSDNLFDSFRNNFTTEYVENKFNYIQDGNDGFYNNSIYIMQYGENLTLKPVE